jgi:hypothetical protein
MVPASNRHGGSDPQGWLRRGRRDMVPGREPLAPSAPVRRALAGEPNSRRHHNGPEHAILPMNIREPRTRNNRP